VALPPRLHHLSRLIDMLVELVVEDVLREVDAADARSARGATVNSPKDTPKDSDEPRPERAP
jgi:hypothetical protein